MGTVGKKPLRVLFVSGTPLGSATCRYRCENMADVLRRAGAQAEVVYIGQPRVRVAHDVVVLYRVCATLEGRRFARAARACGAALVYSTDDVVFDAEQAPPQMGKRFRALAPLHREMLQEADAALASTHYLACLMEAVAPETPVYTLRNFLGADLLALSETARQGGVQNSDTGNIGTVTLGYLSGSPTHDDDLAAVAEPLRKVLEANARADLLIVGQVKTPESLREREASGQVQRRESVPWESLPDLIVKESIRINLAPLDLSRSFCHAKSEVKFLEAAALGLPTVASASKGFREAIPGPNGGMGCFLAAEPSDWERDLTTLIQQAEGRTESGERARQRLQSVGTSEANTAAVNDVFEAIACLRRRNKLSGDVAKSKVVNWPFSPRYALKAALEKGKL